MNSQDDHSRLAGEEKTDGVAVGRVLRPHGVRGAMVFEPYSDVVSQLEPDMDVMMGEAGQLVRIRSIRPHRKRFLLELYGIDHRNAADRYRNLELSLPAEWIEPLPDDTYYPWQIIGLIAVSESGEVLGEVIDIIVTGANDVYVVRNPDGGELLLPAIGDVILKVDLELGQMQVHLIPGLRVQDND